MLMMAAAELMFFPSAPVILAQAERAHEDEQQLPITCT